MAGDRFLTEITFLIIEAIWFNLATTMEEGEEATFASMLSETVSSEPCMYGSFELDGVKNFVMTTIVRQPFNNRNRRCGLQSSLPFCSNVVGHRCHS